MLQLKVQQPLFIHQAAGLDIAAAHDRRDLAGNQAIVFGDITAGVHVLDKGANGRDAAAAEHRYRLGAQRRPVTGSRHRPRFRLGDLQQFKAVHHHTVGRAQVADLARVFGAAADFGHGHRFEVLLQEGRNIPTLGFGRGAHREFLATAARRQQADADLHQADITFQCRHRAVAMHDEFATAAQRQTVDRGHRRHH